MTGGKFGFFFFSTNTLTLLCCLLAVLPDTGGSNKEEFIKNIDFLCLKLSNQKLNDKLLEQIHLYIENINTGYDVDFIKYFYNIDNFIKSILRHASTS